MTNICQDTCDEFKAQGFLKDIDPRTLKESYNISKQADGTWFKNTKFGLHADLTKTNIDFDKMPILKKLTQLIDERDPEFKKLGGRIFITENVVTKIKKGTEYPIIFNVALIEKANGVPQPNEKLCEEIVNQGHVGDRYRLDETYIISKAANGEWFMISTHENHSGKKKNLNLEVMPHLKLLGNKINKLDPAFQANGGRIFITQMRIYRIKNKIELDFNFDLKK